ncbi:hypothetical protein ACIP2Y_43490 [Streptomyces sviceus]|uniref:hypothetical protein n=1 Tax=Streptomyces sviceus TaxID=285530 RepID=UPI003826CB60
MRSGRGQVVGEIPKPERLGLPVVGEERDAVLVRMTDERHEATRAGDVQEGHAPHATGRDVHTFQSPLDLIENAFGAAARAARNPVRGRRHLATTSR